MALGPATIGISLRWLRSMAISTLRPQASPGTGASICAARPAWAVIGLKWWIMASGTLTHTAWAGCKSMTPISIPPSQFFDRYGGLAQQHRNSGSWEQSVLVDLAERKSRFLLDNALTEFNDKLYVGTWNQSAAARCAIPRPTGLSAGD